MLTNLQMNTGLDGHLISDHIEYQLWSQISGFKITSLAYWAVDGKVWRPVQDLVKEQTRTLIYQHLTQEV